MRARMNNPERMRKKRWQVYSLMPGRNALFVSSFDLRQDAQRLIDRQEGCGDDPLFCGEMRLPAARFVLVDAGASDNTKKKFRDACAYYHVELFETQADRLGQAIGKPGRMSAAIAGGSLGERLLTLAREG